MKKVLLSLAIVFACFTGISQNAKVAADGNLVAAQSQSKDKKTGKTFTDAKGIVYPVMESRKGKLYYIRTSKNGKTYKAYLKVG